MASPLIKRKTFYRPSASVILAAQGDTNGESYNYQCLLFKRSAPTAYAPNHCVFPGGVFDEAADENLDWMNYFREFNITEKQLSCLMVDHNHRSGKFPPYPLLTSKGKISRDISLRITALRETFEEIGVLLCRDRKSLKFETPLHFGQVFVGQHFDRAHWQQVVHNDANQFLRLCQFLKVVPDLWCLHEWSVWRSPHTANKKFDTVFYFVGLQQKPQLLLERSEVEQAFWHTPVKFLEHFYKQKIWLPPIQVYEISRMTNAINLQELLKFARQRSSIGTTLLTPFYYRCSDGLVGALPGDDFYPDNPNSGDNSHVYNCSVDQFHKQAQRLHRVTIYDMHKTEVLTNIPPIDGHLSPITKTICKNKL